MTDREIIYRLTRKLCETDAAIENWELNHRPSDDTIALQEIINDLRAKEKENLDTINAQQERIDELQLELMKQHHVDDSQTVKDLQRIIEDKTATITMAGEDNARLQEQLDAANLQVKHLERQLAEAQAAALPEPTKPPYGLQPLTQQEHGKEEKKTEARVSRQPQEVFLECPNGECKHFDSKAKTCKYISEQLGGVNSADTIHSSFVKMHARGAEEIFKGYKLIRTGGSGDGQEQ